MIGIRLENLQGIHPCFQERCTNSTLEFISPTEYQTFRLGNLMFLLGLKATKRAFTRPHSTQLECICIIKIVLYEENTNTFSTKTT